MLSLIVAIADNGAIGLDGKLPWKCPEDLAWFQSITFGKNLIVGRKTAETLPTLWGRKVGLITTKAQDWDSDRWKRHSEKAEEYIVIGGAQVYWSAMPHVDCFYIRRIKEVHQGDTFWPGQLPWETNNAKEGIDSE